MVTLTKYDTKTDYAELAITSFTDDLSDMPTMKKSGAGITRACHGSFATDAKGNVYRLDEDNQWKAY